MTANTIATRISFASILMLAFAVSGCSEPPIPSPSSAFVLVTRSTSNGGSDELIDHDGWSVEVGPNTDCEGSGECEEASTLTLRPSDGSATLLIGACQGLVTAYAVDLADDSCSGSGISLEGLGTTWKIVSGTLEVTVAGNESDVLVNAMLEDENGARPPIRVQSHAFFVLSED